MTSGPAVGAAPVVTSTMTAGSGANVAVLTGGGVVPSVDVMVVVVVDVVEVVVVVELVGACFVDDALVVVVEDGEAAGAADVEFDELEGCSVVDVVEVAAGSSVVVVDAAGSVVVDVDDVDVVVLLVVDEVVVLLVEAAVLVIAPQVLLSTQPGVPP